MIAALNIIDDFLESPDTIRQYALSFDFTQAPEHDGHKYPGFAPVTDERALRYLEQRLLESTGHRFVVRKAHFAAGTADHRTVQWIHADNGVSSFAGVLYLFNEPGWGTAFWRSLRFQTDGLISTLRDYESRILLDGGLSVADDRSDEEIVSYLQEEGKSQEHWTRTDYADSKFNRLIFYPTDRFHSRWPEHGFGDKPENCRLTLAFFFDLAE